MVHGIYIYMVYGRCVALDKFYDFLILMICNYYSFGLELFFIFIYMLTRTYTLIFYVLNFITHMKSSNLVIKIS